MTVHRGDVATLYVTATNSNPAVDITIAMTGLPQGITVAPVVARSGVPTPLVLTVGTSAGPSYIQDPTQPESPSTAQVVAYSQGVSSTANVSVTLSISNPSYVPASGATNLPIVRIDTGGVAIADKSTNVPGTMTISSGDGSKTYLPGTVGSDNTATFHLHGNSTSNLLKKPYKVKLNTGVDLLGGMGVQCPYVNSSNAMICDKSKSYILLANFADKTMLHGWAAFSLAQSIPIGNGYLSPAAGSPTPTNTTALAYWAPHSLFVDVYVNGEYEGIYQLVEDISVDSHRVNIKEMSATDISGKSLTGGYLMEWDARADGDFVFGVPHGTVLIDLDDPDSTPEIAAQTNYISNYMGTVDSTLFGSSYTSPTTGWRSYIDEATLVNYYLVNDLVGNWDSSRLIASAFMYKDRSNNLLYMGPVWDFDLAAGHNIDQPMGPWDPLMQTYSPWFQQLFSDASFKSNVGKQWRKLRADGVVDTWITSIAAKQASMRSAVARDEQRWPYMGVSYWTPNDSFATYDDSVAEFLSWLKSRVSYFDTQFGYAGTAASTTSLRLPSMTMGTPATFTVTVSPSAATGTVVLTQNTIVLGQATLQNGVATVTALPRISGGTTFNALYLGDSTYAPSQATANGSTASAQSPSMTLLQRTGNGLKVLVLTNAGTTVATGTVTLLVDGAMVTQVGLDSTGAALFSTPAATGIHSLTAQYGGDSNYLPSVSTALDATANATTLTSLAVTHGTSDLLIATVTSSGASVPVGTVMFCSAADCLGEHRLGSVALTQSGTASLAVRPVSTVAYVAVFTGTRAYLKSTSNGAASGTFAVSLHTTVTTLAQTTASDSSVALRSTVTGSGTNLPPTGSALLQDADNGNYVVGTATLAAGSAALEQRFSSQAGQSATALLAADLNADGLTDLVTTDAVSGGIAVLLETSTGAFETPVVYQTGAGAASVVAGDFNRDGQVDLAVANPTAGTITILSGIGNGAFAPAGSFATTVPANRLTVADVYGDGAVDLVAASTTANQISVFYGFGDGSFSQAVSYSANSAPLDVLAQDLNGDGHADLAVVNTGAANSGVSVLLNQGDGSFAAPVLYLAGTKPVGMTVAPTEAGIAIAEGDGTVALLANSSNGSLQVSGTFATAAAPIALLRGDFDGDGISDLATAQADGSIALLRGDGLGGYRAVQMLPGSGTPLVAVTGRFTVGANETEIVTASSTGLVNVVGLQTPSAGTVSPLVVVGSGNHKVVGVYGGDTNFLGSQSAAFTVPAQRVTPTLVLSASSGVVDSPITLTAQETHGDAQGHSTDGLNVTFSYMAADGSTTALGTATVQNGVATLVTSDLAPGRDTLQATLAGNDNFADASVQALQVVSFRTLTLAASDVTASYPAATVNVSATVTFTSRHVPNGAVYFQVGSGEPALATCTGSTSPVTCTVALPTDGILPGTYAVQANTTATVSYVSATATSQLIITKGTAIVSLGGLSAVYDGAAHAATASTSPAGLNVGVTYDGSAAAPVSAGTYAVAATVDDIKYAGTAQGTLTIKKATPSITMPVSTPTFGDDPITILASSASKGAFTYSLVTGPATLTGSTLTLQGAGIVTVKASQAETDNYAANSTQVSFNVQKAVSKIAISVSSGTVTPLQTVTVSASVSSAAMATPGGSITFTDNGTVLQTVTLSAGTASLITTLSAGTTHQLAALYSGDANFNGLTSTAGAIGVVVAPLDFTLQAATADASVTLSPPSSATYSVAVMPLYGSFPGLVNLAVSGLPAGVTATFNPASFSANSTGGSTTLALSLSPTASLVRGTRLWVAMVPAGLLGLLGLRTRRLHTRLLAIAIVGLLVCVGLQGCGGGATTPPAKSYVLTITATSGSIAHTQTVTLFVAD